MLFSGPGPSNDDCANAIPIAVGDTAFSTIGATTDNTIGSNENDIWYTFTPAADGVAIFSTCDQADFDTDLLILDPASTCGAQVELDRNDDAPGCTGNTSVLLVAVTGGSTYLLSVGGFNVASVGSGTLSVSLESSPANDACDHAEFIAVGSSTTVDNTTATADPTDPEFPCRFVPGQGAGTLWYSFDATTEAVLLDTLSSTGSTDTLLAVYDGSCGALTEIACNDDDFAGTVFLSSMVVSGLTVGNSYLIQLSSYSDASLGSITLDLEPAPLLQAYNGTGINTATLTADGPAILAKDITFAVGPGPAGSLLFIGRNGLAPALAWPPFGELLIDRSAVTINLTSATTDHLVTVPDNAALIGLDFFAQGLDLATLAATNGLELVIGSF